LIHVCISKNENEHTSWRSINSSNKSNTIMTKNYFTFELKVANVAVSELVKFSSVGPLLEALDAPSPIGVETLLHWPCLK
jgi:hypothetical protein